MKKLLKIFLILAGVLVSILVVASILLKPHFEQFQKKAKLQEIKMVLSSAYTMAMATQAERAIYPPTLEETGFRSNVHEVVYKASPDGKTFKAYIDFDGIRYAVDQERNMTEEPTP